MTHQTGARKAQSAAIAAAMASICNAAGARLMRSPFGLGARGPQGRVTRSLCAGGTRPRVRLALRPARSQREPSHSVSRP